MAGENIVTQSNLGRVTGSYKESTNMKGKLLLAKVTKVHHKMNTVDVEVIKDGTKITSNSLNEGSLGARVLTSQAHFDSVSYTCSGVVEPYKEDQLVVVAFLDNYGNSPVILGSFHDTYSKDTSKTIYPNRPLTQDYPLQPQVLLDDRREALKYLRLFPSQAYMKVDGVGGMEIAHPSRTFLKVDMDDREVINDNAGGFDHEHLSEKDYHRNHATLSGFDEATQHPVSLLFVHNSKFIPEDSTQTKMFLNREGLLRLSRFNNDDKVTFAELRETGAFRVRRQLDNEFIPYVGEDVEELNRNVDSEKFIEVEVSEEGDYNLLKEDIPEKLKITDSIDSENISRTYKKDNFESSISQSKDFSKVTYKSGDVNVEMTMSNSGCQLSANGANLNIGSNGTVSVKTGTATLVIHPNGEISVNTQGVFDVKAKHVHLAGSRQSLYLE